MDKISKTEMSDFSSKLSAKQKKMSRVGYYSRKYLSPKKKKVTAKKEPAQGTSMLIKLGVCAAACALVLAISWARNAPTDPATEVTGGETGSEEDIGKLRFVELPGIFQVFAASDKLISPMQHTNYTYFEDEKMLQLIGDSEANVIAGGNGIVVAIETDQTYGHYVKIRHSNDIYSICYGIEDVKVEVGQPVSKFDRLGEANENGTVFFAITDVGRPVNPMEYLIDIQNEDT